MGKEVVRYRKKLNRPLHILNLSLGESSRVNGGVRSLKMFNTFTRCSGIGICELALLEVMNLFHFTTLDYIREHVLNFNRCLATIVANTIVIPRFYSIMSRYNSYYYGLNSKGVVIEWNIFMIRIFSL